MGGGFLKGHALVLQKPLPIFRHGDLAPAHAPSLGAVGLVGGLGILHPSLKSAHPLLDDVHTPIHSPASTCAGVRTGLSAIHARTFSGDPQQSPGISL